MRKIIIKRDNIKYLLLFLYFISISAHRTGTGFDAIFVRAIFAIILIYNIFDNRRIKISKAFKWNLAFWSFYFVSVLWAKDVSDTTYNTSLAIQILGIFVFLPNYINDKSEIIKTLKVLFFSLVYTAIVVITRTPISSLGTERAGEVVGLNANVLGIRMSVGALISIFLFHSDNKSKMKYMYLLCTVAFSVLSLFSGSKMAVLFLVIGIIIYELYLSKGIKTVLKFVTICCIVILMFYAIFNIPALYSVLGTRIQRTYYTLMGQGTYYLTRDNSLIERRYYIKTALHLFSLNPILGYGGNNFRTYMRGINYSHIAYSHNNYTELLCTLGIVGFSLYYSFWIIIGIKLLKMLHYKTDEKKLLLFLLTILIMLMILDYGVVGYINEFNAIFICIISTYLQRIEKERRNVDEK